MNLQNIEKYLMDTKRSNDLNPLDESVTIVTKVI